MMRQVARHALGALLTFLAAAAILAAPPSWTWWVFALVVAIALTMIWRGSKRC